MAPPADPLSVVLMGDVNNIHLRRWAQAFIDRGYAVSFLVAQGVQIEPGLPDVPVHRYLPCTRWKFRPIGWLRARRSIRRVLDRVRPDILHAHYLTNYGLHAWLSGFRPYVLTVWGSDILINSTRTRKGRLYALPILRGAALVTGDSEELLRVSRARGARDGRLALIQFGVDTSRFSPGAAAPLVRERLGLGEEPVIFAPRSITPLYRHRVMLRAVASLREQPTIVFTRHLTNEKELAAVLREAEELGLADRIRIVADLRHEDMPDFYRLADVVVSIPESDATPVTLLEALACGRPVVATDLPSVREWLSELDPDCLVPVDDVPATAAAIRRALEMPAAQKASLAERGRAMVEARGSQERSMHEMDALYHQVAGRD